MSTVPIRVLIADAYPVVLEGLRSVLNQQPDVQIVGDACDGMEAVDKIVHVDPDVVILDLKLPRLDGLAVLRTLKTRAPRSRVLLFASSDHKDEFVEAMKIGCAGILLKDGPTSLIERS